MRSGIRNIYLKFISEQLSEMVKSIQDKLEENEIKRKENNFLLFKDEKIRKYMGLGRSFDSQLGNRLQNIAFFSARKRFGLTAVPNIVILQYDGEGIHVVLVSYDYKYGFNQRVYWEDKSSNTSILDKEIKKKTKYKNEVVNELYFKCDNNKVKQIEALFKSKDKKRKGIPIDLVVFENNLDGFIIAHTYEIKAGGNLDTKNAASNAKEVRDLQTIFSFCDKSISKFATCYDSSGEGNPVGSIGNRLTRDEIVIGKEFWKEILEDEVSYEDFIDIYEEAFAEAKVEDILIG